ncbi:hypothetical protein [Pelagibacterium lacus]|uniref:Uncharacterized protein n=1 Tax=Pelagibacterium lacus TaxID=2282655 RepID=A0A369W3X3_9HYPH|nr:hypothetical protein [Pelagibacterium lacus]RDE08707.1 hypothetical protein DVH29_10460 [Pelagibacterium lacus]
MTNRNEARDFEVGGAQPALGPEALGLVLSKINGWIDRHLDAGGSWKEGGDLSAYFAPILFCLQVGRRQDARRMLAHVEKNLADPEEVLRQAAYRDGMVSYVPSWVLFGAYDAECYDLAARLAGFVESFQAPGGGFFGSRDERDARAGQIDFDATTMSVIGLGRSGRADSAGRGAEFLLKLLAAQPDPERVILTEWQEGKGLVPVESVRNPVSVVDHGQTSQKYFKVGLIVTALAHAYGATGERRFLDAAIATYDQSVSRASQLWDNTAAHKMCWASTTLFAVTGEPRFAQHSWRYASHLVTNQNDDGTFHYPEIWPEFPPQRWEMIPNMMCQFGLWLARTAQTPNPASAALLS